MILPPIVLWADPGKMTGLALLERGAAFSVREREFAEAGTFIWLACSQWKSALAVGYERYDIRRGTPQRDAHYAIEMIGVLRFAAQAWHCRILKPARQATPSPAERAKLEALGWWRPGEDDSQSAAAHMMRWCLREDCLPPRYREALAAVRAG